MKERVEDWIVEHSYVLLAVLGALWLLDGALIVWECL